MNVVVFVRNREAIPVRALPFVTGWTLSPDVVAKELAESQDSALPPRLLKLRAYQEKEKGELIELLPKEWDAIGKRLEVLSR